MQIRENENLAPYTTFKIGGKARFFCDVVNEEEISEAIGFANQKQVSIFILGGGSNVVVSDEGFDGLVIRPRIKSIATVKEDDNHVWIGVGAGETWDEIVKMAVSNGWWGIENLSHIPGSTGAVAVQNVGAYGQEASQTVEFVTAYDTETGVLVNIEHHKCDFGYRKSIFNSSLKGRYIIVSTVFKLSKNSQPNLGYRDLALRFEGKNPSLGEIREAVIEIRNKKFPFPVEAVNGNAGSFFKNPIVSDETFDQVRNKIQSNFGEEAVQKLDSKCFGTEGAVKIPAALLIDLCGLKNLQVGGAAINENQPLVILNKTGSATANDVLALAGQIKSTVYEKTGVQLSQEPELVGF